MLGIILITFSFSNDNNLEQSLMKIIVFCESEVYVISGDFDFGNYEIKFGSLIVEILEINDKWIRVDILSDENVKKF